MGEKKRGKEEDVLPQLLNRSSVPHDLHDNLLTAPLLHPFIQFPQTRRDSVDRVGRLPVIGDEEDLLFGKDDCGKESLNTGAR
jgi:hypothetical protein